jgi:hypothetical protein
MSIIGAVRCPETADGRHVIEPRSVRPGDGHAGLTEDGVVTLSVTCAACGASGDAELSPSAVVWDDP